MEFDSGLFFFHTFSNFDSPPIFFIEFPFNYITPQVLRLSDKRRCGALARPSRDLRLRVRQIQRNSGVRESMCFPKENRSRLILVTVYDVKCPKTME